MHKQLHEMEDNMDEALSTKTFIKLPDGQVRVKKITGTTNLPKVVAILRGISSEKSSSRR
jgi:hypothetical protein